MSDETKAKVSAAKTGHSTGVSADPEIEAERRRKISEGRKRYWAAKKAAKNAA